MASASSSDALKPEPVTERIRVVGPTIRAAVA